MVALPGGGSADMIARVVSQALGDQLGQSFVVDNKAGGSGQIGMPQVARSPADGYMLTCLACLLPHHQQKHFQELGL